MVPLLPSEAFVMLLICTLSAENYGVGGYFSIDVGMEFFFPPYIILILCARMEVSLTLFRLMQYSTILYYTLRMAYRFHSNASRFLARLSDALA